MRSSSISLLALLAAACGGDGDLTVHGRLVPDSEATEVYVLGAAERAGVDADSFQLTSRAADTLSLRFARGRRDPARMQLTGLPSGGEVRLEGIWFSGDLAFPTRVALPEGHVATVNGLRMASPEALPARIDVTGTVLASSREGDALLVRPHDPALPDLRVVVTLGTVVRTEDGDPLADQGEAPEVDAEFGDTLRVVGQGVDGYVVATEVVLPRERTRGSLREPSGGRSAEPRLTERSTPTSAPSAARDGGGGGGDRPIVASEIPRGRGGDEAREDRGRKADKGRGKGRDKKD